MKLSEILKGVEVLSVNGDTDRSVVSVCYDSRKAEKNSLFVAIEGFKEKGSNYIFDAVKAGASCVVCGKGAGAADPEVTLVEVNDARAALSVVSANFYGNPSKKMQVVGITGTNGKTTMTYLVESVAAAAEKKCAVMGTVTHRGCGYEEKAMRTTPESADIQEFLSKMADGGADCAVMEISSHSTVLRRVDDINFDVCLFTNLTSDHLDFHKTREEYFQAKKLLFEKILKKSSKKRKYAVLNFDDPYAERIAKATGAKIVTYGLKGNFDVSASRIKVDESGICAKVKVNDTEIDVESKLIGEFNLSNILGAVGICYCLGFEPSAISRGINALENVPGRLERIKNQIGLNIYVDYAHTEDALKNVIGSLNAVKRGRLITIFGCGGDRDREKRPMMGAVATSMSDISIITSDNPRSEDPVEIIDEILKGVDTKIVKRSDGLEKPEAGKRIFVTVPDRKEAISTALGMAREGDSILIAGKGHEDYQEIKGERTHFSDSEYVELLLKREMSRNE